MGISKTAMEVYKRNLYIAELRATGKSQTEIAKLIGITQQSVSHALKDSEVRVLLDDVHRYYASFATAIGGEFIKLCFDDDKAIRTKNIAEYNKIMGITPSHTVNQFLQQIYIDNRSVTPQDQSAIAKLLEFKRKTDLEKDIIDIKEVKDK